jgi:molecular chaperone DnaJ
MHKDPYKILGVDKNVSQDEILKAYRFLAQKYHPDKNPENPIESAQKFKELSAAFDLIGDEQSRRKYDLFGFNTQPSFSFKNRNSVDDFFDNIFSHFFGDQKNSKTRIKISLFEAYFGCKKNIKSENHKFCESCKGTGSALWEPCSKCDNKGFIFTNNGSLKIQVSCSNCGGKGSISVQKCKECQSRGYIVDYIKNVEVKIPPGIDDGCQIRLAGEAADGSDLFIVVNIEKDAKITREGKDLLSYVEIPYHVVVLGGNINYDLFGSKIDIKVKSNTKPGSRICLKGQGMPLFSNPNLRGDLFLDVRLKMPKTISKEYKDILIELSKIESYN